MSGDGTSGLVGPIDLIEASDDRLTHAVELGRTEAAAIVHALPDLTSPVSAIVILFFRIRNATKLAANRRMGARLVRRTGTPQIKGAQDEAAHQVINIGRRCDDRFRKHSCRGTESGVCSGPGVRAHDTGSL